MRLTKKRIIPAAAIAGGVVLLVFLPVIPLPILYTSLYNLSQGPQPLAPGTCTGANCFGDESSRIASVTYYLFGFGGVLNKSSTGQIASPECVPQCYTADPNSSLTSYGFVSGALIFSYPSVPKKVAPPECNSLIFPQYTISSTQETWSYSSCLVPGQDTNRGQTPEIYYTIAGPWGSTFSVNATIIAKLPIEVVLIQSGTLVQEEGASNSINGNSTVWKVSNLPCEGAVTCSIDVINNAPQINDFTMTLSATP